MSLSMRARDMLKDARCQWNINRRNAPTRLPIANMSQGSCQGGPEHRTFVILRVTGPSALIDRSSGPPDVRHEIGSALFSIT